MTSKRKGDVYLLPKDLVRPSYTKAVPILGIITIIFFVLGIFNILFMLPAVLMAIIDCIYLATSKKFKVSLFMQQAIDKYKQGNLMDARMLCNKALGIDAECKEALMLVNHIIETESHT